MNKANREEYIRLLTVYYELIAHPPLTNPADRPILDKRFAQRADLSRAMGLLVRTKEDEQEAIQLQTPWYQNAIAFPK